jgi:sulfonate transport system substrate-binding protein
MVYTFFLPPAPEGNMRKFKLGLASVFTVLALGTGALQSAEPVKIRVAWQVPMNFGSILLEKKDLAKHLGKSYLLEPVRYNGSPPMITALAVGELEIADLSFSTIPIAILNAGMDDLRIISDEIQDGVQGRYSNEYMVRADSPIRKIEDLKGKVLATNALGSGVDITMRAMLHKHGLEDRRDYTAIETPFPTMRAMLTEKKADLITAILPFALDPELRKTARILFDQKEAYGVTQIAAWTARKPFLDKNRAAMLDFMEDTFRIVRWYLDPANHKDVTEIGARITKQPAEQFAYVFTDEDYYHDPDMLPNLDALQKNIDLMKDLGYLRSSVDIKKYADLGIVKEAAERLK